MSKHPVHTELTRSRQLKKFASELTELKKTGLNIENSEQYKKFIKQAQQYAKEEGKTNLKEIINERLLLLNHLKDSKPTNAGRKDAKLDLEKKRKEEFKSLSRLYIELDEVEDFLKENTVSKRAARFFSFNKTPKPQPKTDEVRIPPYVPGRDFTGSQEEEQKSTDSSDLSSVEANDGLLEVNNGKQENKNKAGRRLFNLFGKKPEEHTPENPKKSATKALLGASFFKTKFPKTLEEGFSDQFEVELEGFLKRYNEGKITAEDKAFVMPDLQNRISKKESEYKEQEKLLRKKLVTAIHEVPKNKNRVLEEASFSNLLRVLGSDNPLSKKSEEFLKRKGEFLKRRDIFQAALVKIGKEIEGELKKQQEDFGENLRKSREQFANFLEESDECQEEIIKFLKTLQSEDDWNGLEDKIKKLLERFELKINAKEEELTAKYILEKKAFPKDYSKEMWEIEGLKNSEADLKDLYQFFQLLEADDKVLKTLNLDLTPQNKIKRNKGRFPNQASKEHKTFYEERFQAFSDESVGIRKSIESIKLLPLEKKAKEKLLSRFKAIQQIAENIVQNSENMISLQKKPMDSEEMEKIGNTLRKSNLSDISSINTLHPDLNPPKTNYLQITVKKEESGEVKNNVFYVPESEAQKYLSGIKENKAIRYSIDCSVYGAPEDLETNLETLRDGFGFRVNEKWNRCGENFKVNGLQTIEDRDRLNKNVKQAIDEAIIQAAKESGLLDGEKSGEQIAHFINQAIEFARDNDGFSGEEKEKEFTQYLKKNKSPEREEEEKERSEDGLDEQDEKESKDKQNPTELFKKMKNFSKFFQVEMEKTGLMTARDADEDGFQNVGMRLKKLPHDYEINQEKIEQAVKEKENSPVTFPSKPLEWSPLKRETQIDKIPDGH